MCANANPPSRGSAPRVGSRARAPSAGRCSEKVHSHSGVAPGHLANDQVARLGWGAYRSGEDAGLVRKGRVRTVRCPSRVRARALGPRVRARRVECCASAAAPPCSRGENISFSFSPSHGQTVSCGETSELRKSLRETFFVFIFGNFGGLGCWPIVKKSESRLLIGFPSDYFIDRALQSWVELIGSCEREDFAEDFDDRVFREIAHVCRCAWRPRSRLRRGTCERRTTAQAASSSPTWEVDQIGSRRVSRDESSAEVWEFSGGPERKFRPSAVASRGDAPVRMSGRTKAVELLDAIEGRAGSASTMSTSVDDGDALFGVVLTSRYVTRHRKTTASTPLATTCARKPHRLRDAARGARATGAPPRDARRVSRREMHASQATSRARFRAFASPSLITTPRDRPPAPL
jgi:hypothetical protein